MGRLNFGGFVLNLFEVNESYEDENGKEQFYFPADGAMVTAPGCGHMMYGQITQIDYGSADHKSYAAPRVAKLTSRMIAVRYVWPAALWQRRIITVLIFLRRKLLAKRKEQILKWLK